MMFFLTLERIREILSQTFIIKRVINNMACSLKTTNHFALDDMEKEDCSSLKMGGIYMSDKILLTCVLVCKG